MKLPSELLACVAIVFGALAVHFPMAAAPCLAAFGAWGWLAHLERREDVKALAAIHNDLAKLVEKHGQSLVEDERRIRALENKILPEMSRTFGPLKRGA